MNHGHTAAAQGPDERSAYMRGNAGSSASLRDQPCPSGLDGVLHRVRVVVEHLSALHAIADRSCGEVRNPPECNGSISPSPNGMLEHVEAELNHLISSAEAAVDRFRKLD